MLFTECWDFSSPASLMWVACLFPNGGGCLWYSLLFVQLKYVSLKSNHPHVLSPWDDNFMLISVSWRELFKVTYQEGCLNLFISKKKCKDNQEFHVQVSELHCLFFRLPVSYVGILGLVVRETGGKLLCCDVDCTAFCFSPWPWCLPQQWQSSRGGNVGSTEELRSLWHQGVLE